MIVINIVTTTYVNRLEPIIKKFVQKIHILRIQIAKNLLLKHSVKKKSICGKSETKLLAS